MIVDRVIESGQLRVVFQWCGDRYSHTVERLVEGIWTPCLMSVEGTAEDDWPPSPPLQTLHIEQREIVGSVALLVGRAGTSHWSASVEPFPEGGGGFSFDVACRIQENPAWLGSRYRLLTASAACGVAISPDPSLARLETEPGGDRAVRPIEAASSLPGTVRWRYQLRTSG
jgi:hypothetical protein